VILKPIFLIKRIEKEKQMIKSEIEEAKQQVEHFSKAKVILIE